MEPTIMPGDNTVGNTVAHKTKSRNAAILSISGTGCQEDIMKTEMPINLQGSTQRTKLRLSVSAEEVIRDDIQNFMLETNRTGFLNHLFITLFHHSEANIDQEIEKKRQYFLSVLQNDKKMSKAQKEETAGILAESYRCEFAEKYTTELKKKQKSEEFNIRLNNDVYQPLSSGADQNAPPHQYHECRKANHNANLQSCRGKGKFIGMSSIGHVRRHK